MDSQIDLQQPIVDGGIRSVNFFNGRMLTARDLTREQAAIREVDRRLGQAVGEGIAYGFEVSSPDSPNDAPVVSVEPGLAVNRQGQTLWLQAKTNVALVRKASASVTGTIFAECKPLQAGTYVAGAGVYLLTVAPAETREGRAVTSALNTGGAPCNTDSVVSAVQFRLIQINPPITATELGAPNLKYLRNVIAYKCFGVSETNSFLTDPLGVDLEKYGLLDSLRPDRLTECDVPLGVLFWTLADGIKFIDMWSVRRRLTERSRSERWSLVADDRRVSEGEAIFLQFQDHVRALNGPTGRSLKAVDHFLQLPPAGIIPVATEGSAPGFDYRAFFQDQTYREPRFIEGARFEQLIRDSFSYPPITLGSGETIWLYQVRQNMQTIAAGGTPQPCLIFSSGHMPDYGEARFDLNRYNYSNYSSVYD